MPTTLRIKRRSAGAGSSGPSTLAASELAFNETSGSRILYYGLGNDGYGTATSVIAIGGPDFNPSTNLSGVITSNNSVTSITSQTGTGTKFVVDTSPTLITPILGVATATSVNKITFTQPATSATLTIADGATLSVPSTGSISGTNTGDNAVNSLYSGLVSNATHTGDATGSTALTVVRINGQSLAALSTGLLKNTTTTGVPSIAVAGTDYVAPGGALGTPSSGTLTNCTFPTLNQNTTGTAANVTGVVAVANGGTGQTSSTGSGAVVLANTPTLITPNIGAATGTSLVLSGNLTVNGSVTTISSTTLDVGDKNIVLASASTTDAGADGGGITIKGLTDKTFNWIDAHSWTSSEHIDLATGKVLKINGTIVLSATALSGVDIDGGSF